MQVQQAGNIVRLPRGAISKKTRFEVFKRDDFRCQYCGAHPPDIILQVDHIVAVAAGGSSEMDNYVTACAPCNLGKGARDLLIVPQSLAEKAAEIAEREQQLLGYQEIMQARRDRLEEETWRVMGVLRPLSESVPKKEFQSARMFVERLGLDECLDAAEIAVAAVRFRNAFRYFCGVCWNRLRDRE